MKAPGSLDPSIVRRIVVTCAAVCIIGAPATARAAGMVGTGTAASCTDAALNAALAGGGLVTFKCGGPATIDISSGTGTKTIAADTTIDGGGVITISGGHTTRVFNVDPVTFTVENLTIADGRAYGGGGIANSGGILTINNSTFTGNSAIELLGTGTGGGIVNFNGIPSGILTVTNSTFTGNTADIGGGGIADFGELSTVTNSTFAGNTAGVVGGGIATSYGLTVTNSTFTGNSAGGDGGGLGTFGGPLTVTNSTFTGNSAGGDGGGLGTFGGPLTVTNSTFTGNRASTGGGIFNGMPDGTSANAGAVQMNGETRSESSSAGSAVLRNTIVANSPSGGNCAATSDSAITDGGHNLDDGTSCGFSAADGSLSNTDPQLDPSGLQDNGGPTQTVALCKAAGVPAGCTAASPAIDAGDQPVCAAALVHNRDQRGFVRPGSGHTDCSMGAYEPDAAPRETCIGDCDDRYTVAVNDVITLVNIALGNARPSACPNGISSGTEVTVAVIIKAVNNALNGCSG